MRESCRQMAPPPARGESSLQRHVLWPNLRRPVNVMLVRRRVAMATQTMEIGSAKVVEESGIERMIGGGKEVTRQTHRRMTMKSTDESAIERSKKQKRIENEKARGIARRGGGNMIVAQVA